MASLEASFLRWVDRTMTRVAPCIEARSSADAPRDQGTLSASISGTYVGRNAVRARIELVQDGDAAPHGAIINNPHAPGGRIFGSPVLRFQSGGGTVFARSVEQSTVHAGWWDDQPLDEWLQECWGRAAGGSVRL